MNIEKLIKKLQASDSAAAKTIIMFLVVVMIIASLFGTIAYQLNTVAANSDVATIPGATVMIGIVGLLGVVIIVMWAIKKAF